MAKRCSDLDKLLDKAEEVGGINNSEFTDIIQKFLISEGGYVLDTGNGMMVNAEVVLRLEKKIKRHPWLWKKFFMVG